MSLSYVHGVGTTPLIADTIGGALNRAVERWGDRDALVACHQQLRYSYRELRQEADRAARALMALGVRRGDRVGIWSGNRAEWMITQYAAAKMGAVLVNINPAYRLRELEYALTHSGVSVLISARGFRATDYVDMLLGLLERLPALRRVVYLGTDPQPGGIAWSDFLELGDGVAARELEAREATLQFDDPINIQYTSGTTGSPKGATLSDHNILNNGYFVGEVLRYTEFDRICVPVPFYHCFGCVLGNMAAVTHGSAVVIPGESFDPDATLRAIEAEGCTSIYGVPTMFIAQLDHPRFSGFQLETLRTGIMAGAPCPIDVMCHVIGRMHVPEVTICYGMTETSPVSFQSQVDDPIELRVSTVGRFKALADRKKELFDGDIEALVMRAGSDAAGPWSLHSLDVATRDHRPARVTIALAHTDGRVVRHEQMADGPVDAVVKAIDHLTGMQVQLRTFDVHSMTVGDDAQGEALLTVECDGRTYRGAGISTNIIEAAARAYLEVVNRIDARSLRCSV